MHGVSGVRAVPLVAAASEGRVVVSLHLRMEVHHAMALWSEHNHVTRRSAKILTPQLIVHGTTGLNGALVTSVLDRRSAHATSSKCHFTVDCRAILTIPRKLQHVIVNAINKCSASGRSGLMRVNVRRNVALGIK